MKTEKTIWLKCIIVAIVLIVLIPVVINELYKMNTGYITMWGAPDVLNYYGAILGSLVTVGALVITIIFTKKQIQHDDYRQIQNNKWNRIHQTLLNAIEKNNPISVFQITIDFGNGDIQRCIAELQKNIVSAYVAFDETKLYIEQSDYYRIMPIINELQSLHDELQLINNQLVNIYMDLAKQYSEEKHDEAFPLRKKLIELHNNEFQKLIDIQQKTISEIYRDNEKEAGEILKQLFKF